VRSIGTSVKPKPDFEMSHHEVLADQINVPRNSHFL
jgi:hypothetical protein